MNDSIFSVPRTLRRAAGVLLFCVSGAVQAAWTITDLGTLGGVRSAANDVSDQGAVVGASELPLVGPPSRFNQADVHGFLFRQGVMLDLGPAAVGVYTAAYGINNYGAVAGGNNMTGGFLHADGVTTDLGTRLGTPSDATGINCGGMITGSRTLEGGVTRAYILDRGNLRNLGTLASGDAGLSYGRDINDLGQVVGNAFVDVGVFHAFLYSNGRMRDLGTLGGTTSEARRVNELGQVVGFSTNSAGVTRAFLYSGGAMRDLGTLGSLYSYAYGINNWGHVVGSSSTTSGAAHAFLYRDGRMWDLNVLPEIAAAGWTELNSATAINDRGQITGFGVIGGQEHAFLLTPPADRVVNGALSVVMSVRSRCRSGR